MADSGVKIFINVNDLDRAKEIMDLNTNNGVTNVVCPKCSSNNIAFTLGKNKLKKIFILFISLFAFSPIKNNYGAYKCKDCKTKFTG